jgi:hypothetical protein
MDFVCYIHHAHGEIVRSVYFNSIRNEIIKISMHEGDNFRALHCFCAKLEDVTKWQPLFDDDEIVSPGFVEFDSRTDRIIVFEGERGNYRVRSLSGYELVYEVESHGIIDRKMTERMLLIASRANAGEVAIGLHGDGEEMTLNVPVWRDAPLELVDRHELNLFMKQTGKELRVHDLALGKVVSIPETGSLVMSDILFLNAVAKMVIKTNGEFRVFTFQGHYLFTITSPRKLANFPMCVTQRQDLLIATSQTQFDQWITVFSLADGEMLFEAYIPPHVHNGYKISALAYDEPTGMLVTGDSFGTITFWG